MSGSQSRYSAYTTEPHIQARVSSAVSPMKFNHNALQTYDIHYKTPRCYQYMALTHSLARSLTHSLTHSFTHPLFQLFTQPLTHPPTHSLSHSLIHPHTLSLTRRPLGKHDGFHLLLSPCSVTGLVWSVRVVATVPVFHVFLLQPPQLLVFP